MNENQTPYQCAVLTVSDRSSRRQRLDTSGPALCELLAGRGFRIGEQGLVPDEITAIQRVLIDWTDQRGIDLIITTGGTGLSPRDVTPEATRPLLDLEIPGISETMRLANIGKTINAVLSRGLAGTRKKSLIINLPGSERAAIENLQAVIEVLPHALYKLQGGTADCGEERRSGGASEE